MARKGTAFLRGMTVGGVVATTKHFPGLGRVHANTDTSRGVTDRGPDDLRGKRVVISDDLANADQVSPWRPGTRAVKFVAAGGDLVLTVNPSTLPAMYNAVLTRARTNATFRSKVNQAALRVLKLKEKQGLLGR